MFFEEIGRMKNIHCGGKHLATLLEVGAGTRPQKRWTVQKLYSLAQETRTNSTSCQLAWLADECTHTHAWAPGPWWELRSSEQPSASRTLAQLFFRCPGGSMITLYRSFSTTAKQR